MWVDNTITEFYTWVKSLEMVKYLLKIAQLIMFIKIKRYIDIDISLYIYISSVLSIPTEDLSYKSWVSIEDCSIQFYSGKRLKWVREE